MAVVPFAPVPKLAAHLDPIMRALPEIGGEDIALVASYNSLVQAKRRGFRRIVLAQHGAGQSYGGDTRSARNPGYPGGDKNDAVGLFLCPNEYSADRWRRRYPEATVRVVGCPRLDTLPARDPAAPFPVVAVTFHWHGYNCPEFGSAANEYLPALRDLAQRYKVIGTGHPQRRDLANRYASLGVEHVASFDEIARRADVLIFDNSSAGFEFAALGRPVVVLNSRHYRHDVYHGGRFWDWGPVGANVTPPDKDLGGALVEAVETALLDPPLLRRWRELIVSEIYQPRQGGARLAAAAIVAWAG